MILGRETGKMKERMQAIIDGYSLKYNAFCMIHAESEEGVPENAAKAQRSQLL